MYCYAANAGMSKLLVKMIHKKLDQTDSVILYRLDRPSQYLVQ